MDYEEKYKEALEMVRRLHDRMKVLSSTDALVASSELEFIFPELAESDDERIRRGLIEYHKQQFENNRDQEVGLFHKDALAYLEKQEIFSKGEGCYYYHADGSYTFIGSMGFGPVEDIKLNGERPKTENKGVDLPGATLCVEKQKEQKPDTRYSDDLQLLGFIYDLLNDEIEWKDNWAMSKDECLRRLNNYRPQKPIEWSDSFEENIRILLHDKLTWHSEDGSISSTTLIDDKTLKDIISGIWFYVGKEALKYPNKELNVTEWSEEDSINIRDLIGYLNGNAHFLDSESEVSFKKRLIYWLSSLRPSWKPSEEQMKALEAATVRYQSTGLESLYEDLKKVM